MPLMSHGRKPSRAGLQEGDWFVDRESEGDHAGDPFLADLPPKTVRELLNDLWHGHRALSRELREVRLDVDDVKAQGRVTNGRLTKLERFQYLLTGGGVLLAIQASVVAAIIGTSS